MKYVTQSMRYGKRMIRMSGDPFGPGPWFGDAGEPGFIVVLTKTDERYVASLEHRTSSLVISGERKITPGAALASLQHVLSAIRRAS